jgi:Putative auto-transporter adhesin, head GIN domain
MKSLRTVFLLVALPITSCGKFSSAIFAIHEGNGTITVETLHPGEFHSVDLGGAYDVTIVQGPESEVRIETDQNLLQNITATIKNGELTISSEGYLRPTKSIFITISSPNYNVVDIEGSSDVKAATPITSDDLSLDLEGSGSFNMEVHAQRLKSSIEGSGDIKLTGDTHSHSVEIDGSGDLAAGKLSTDTTKVQIDGSGDASLSVANRLDASIAGSGSVRYTGNVKDVHTNIEGSGSVDRASN